jgi:Zn-dependent M16 (insulinase) family peptidase
VQTVHFPCDSEANSNGIVSIGWRGPQIVEMRLLIALDLLFYYLTDSSISPLQAHFIQANAYCNKISYRIDDYAVTALSLSFTNVQLESLEKIGGELSVMLRDLVATKLTFDLKRMENIIKMKLAEIKDKFEDSPHETASNLCIGDFLYGSCDNKFEVFTTEL